MYFNNKFIKYFFISLKFLNLLINFNKKKMKKLILSIAAVLTFGFANAQDAAFKAGIHAGLPIGDAGNVYSFNAGVDVAYMWAVSDEFKVGATTGYSYFAGKTIDTVIPFFGTIKTKVPAAGFIPVAGSAQYSVSENLFLGADLGYALYVGDANSDGGLYYQPKFGYQTDKVELYLGYRGISVNGGSITSVALGFNYKF